ncbi:30S ribosome-binding factor RbfA [bacterium]|nr:30S ribosome-binding factor RbfA [bacterium]
MRKRRTSRPIRLAQNLKREISYILQEKIKDPRMGFVSIVGVILSPDLRVAKVHYSVFGGEKKRKSTQIFLERSKPYIEHILAERLFVRYTPELIFVYDPLIEESVRINEIIDEFGKGSGADKEQD